jgi:peroxiredoxin
VKRRFLFTVVVLCAFLAAGCSYFSPVKASGKGGKPAPEFALQDEHGKTVRLSDYKGKVVILDFWATWCGPCKIEIPWFIEMQRKYKDKGFTVIGVSMDEGGWQEVRPFVEEMKMNYPVLIGNDDTAAAFGGVDVLPTTLIIDKQGRIIATHQGLTSKDEFEKAIESLL